MEENESDVNENLSFEEFKNENGLAFWWASDLMNMLGYKDMKSFQKVIDRAIKVFMTVGINHYDNIRAFQRDGDGVPFNDFKLSRFACYVTVMNADSKKPEVANAQVYFAQQTRNFEIQVQSQYDLERMLIRDELTEGNKQLSSTIKSHSGNDTINYAFFQNAGYIGMYNMNVTEIENRRGIKKGKLLDYMGRTELAANLFRVTQTEERIKNKNIQGQSNLEQTHHDVGKEIRKMVISNTGLAPEKFPQEKLISEVKKEIKESHKKMLSVDNKKKDKKK